MVCSKCAARQKSTTLATPGVKRRSDHFYGSAASTSTNAAAKAARAAVASGSGAIGKSKLLGSSAKNALAAYSASCERCKTKIEQGRALCQTCAFKNDACYICGKSNDKKGAVKGAITGKKFSSK